MGVRGLTTFIANRSSQYLEHYELHDSYLVVDGNSLGSQLYKWHCKCNDCFGGDYDKYVNVIKKFFKLLSDCRVIPLVVLDGAYEKRKVKTVYSRMKNRIRAGNDLTSVTEGTVTLFPLFLRELFVDILLDLGVKCVRCDFEGDSHVASLARNLGCPVLSYDSDFFIFDVLYIPFSTMDLRMRTTKNVNYISCEVYRAEKFLNSFGGMNKTNLPLLAVLLGNDYVKRSAFLAFYSHLKMQRSKECEQQRVIKSLIQWLKNETPESALRKIMGRYKLAYRKRLAAKIQMAIEGYQCENNDLHIYFNVERVCQEESLIAIPKPEDVDEDEDAEGEYNASEDSSEEEALELEPGPTEIIPAFFHKNFEKCVYPACFMDMLVSHRYYCIVQMEDFSKEHSHTISLDILKAIYKILTFPSTKNLICIGRWGRTSIRHVSLPFYEKDLPRLVDIENMNIEMCRKTLLEILNMQNVSILNEFPPAWHLFLIAIKYWITSSKSSTGAPYVYSAVLCAIILNCVDKQIGFFRSTKAFLNKYKSNLGGPKLPVNSLTDVISSLESIDVNNSICCMSRLIHYFQMDVKMRTNVKLFDSTIVHEFAEFQSCLLHIKYLNCLLKCPYIPIVISNFYDGTFLYNVTANLLTRTDLKQYFKTWLQICPSVSSCFELINEKMESDFIVNLWQDPPKRKKKKRRCKKPVADQTVSLEISEEEYVLDSNNVFSVLPLINQ